MSKKKTSPRKVPSRDDFYMGLAFWIASRSKDPKTQCGALIVDPQNCPLGMGYNGPPAKIKDDDIDWSRPEKYPFIIHAEENAIKHSFGDLEGSTIYVTGMPCNKCMLTIVDSGIKRVVYKPVEADSGSMLSDATIAAKTEQIAQLGGVRIDKFFGNLNWMRDRISFMESLGIFKNISLNK